MGCCWPADMGPVGHIFDQALDGPLAHTKGAVKKKAKAFTVLAPCLIKNKAE